MTLVIIHSSSVHDKIIAYSDSRVSGTSKYTDSASKLFSLPIRVTDVSRQNVLLSTSFGFAYAGSTLSAFSTYSFCASALLGLFTSKEEPPPSLAKIVKFVGYSSKDYIREIAETSGGNSCAEIAVFGYCPIESSRQVFLCKPIFENGEFNMVFGEVDSSPGMANFLGETSAQHAYIELNRTLGVDPGATLQSLIESERFPSVGGSVQVLSVDRDGATPLPTLHRVGENRAKVMLLGKELDGLGEQCDLKFGANTWGIFD